MSKQPNQVQSSPLADLIFEAVARCANCRHDQLTKQSRLVEDLGVDSIDVLALTADLEEELHIQIDDQAFRHLQTIEDVIVSVSMTLETQHPHRE